MKEKVIKITSTAYFFVLLCLNLKQVPKMYISLMICTFMYICVDYICNIGSKICLEKCNNNSSNNKKVFALTFSIMIIAMGSCWIAYFPGGMNLDALGQWEQVHYGYLDNWHPIANTLFIKGITRICDDFGFYILVQILAFALSVGYFNVVLYKIGIRIEIILLATIGVALNPGTLNTAICMYKDVAFTIFAILMMGLVIQIYSSAGAILNQTSKLVVFIITTFFCTLMRHNGCLFTFPVLFLGILLYPQFRKNFLISAFSVIILILTTKCMLYPCLDVRSHDNILGEVVGVPMAILGNEIVQDSICIDDETHEFLNTIASDDEWREYYVCGEWDSMRWEFGGSRLLQNEKLSKILKLTLKSVVRNPDLAFESFSENTRVIFQVVGNSYWWYEPYIEENEFGILMISDNKLRSIIQEYSYITTPKGISTFFWNLGTAFLIESLCFMISLIKHNYSKIIIVLPVLIYNIGTALLLAGPNYRYFYLNVPVISAIVLVTFIKE